jgi:bacterioferritin-associated ferredoxin
MDVTEEEVIELIRDGVRDIQLLKRLTRVGTGPCQGKACLEILVKILARETGLTPDEVGLITLRQPVDPVRIGTLAGEVHEEEC